MKKLGIFVLCTVLCTTMLSGAMIRVLAEEEVSSGENETTETASQVEIEGSMEAGESSTEEESEIPPSILSSDEQENFGSNNDNLLEEGDLTSAETDGEVQEEYEENPDAASAMEAAYTSMGNQIDHISNLLNMEGSYILVEGEDNFHEALGIYAIRHGKTENYPYEVEITSEEDFNELQSIYWSLNIVNGVKTEENSIISVLRLSGKDVFSLTRMEQGIFEKLISEENREKVSALLQN